MSPVIKISVAAVIAVIAYTVSALLHASDTGNTGAGAIDLPLLATFLAATVITALLVRDAPAIAGSHTTDQPAGFTDKPSGTRESGQVKWFNVSKGFGFITKEDGEEIFVHFRSIRGEGRRSLRDGQRVSFMVAQSAKGPQAEDVTAEQA